MKATLHASLRLLFLAIFVSALSNWSYADTPASAATPSPSPSSSPTAGGSNAVSASSSTGGTNAGMQSPTQSSAQAPTNEASIETQLMGRDQISGVVAGISKKIDLLLPRNEPSTLVMVNKPIVNDLVLINTYEFLVTELENTGDVLLSKISPSPSHLKPMGLEPVIGDITGIGTAIQGVSSILQTLVQIAQLVIPTDKIGLQDLNVPDEVVSSYVHLTNNKIALYYPSIFGSVINTNPTEPGVLSELNELIGMSTKIGTLTPTNAAQSNVIAAWTNAYATTMTTLGTAANNGIAPLQALMQAELDLPFQHETNTYYLYIHYDTGGGTEKDSTSQAFGTKQFLNAGTSVEFYLANSNYQIIANNTTYAYTGYFPAKELIGKSIPDNAGSTNWPPVKPRGNEWGDFWNKLIKK